MRRQVHIVVLYEGYRDRCFIREYLRQCGYNVGRNVYFRLCSKGRGSGEQSVRVQYPKELLYVRSYATKNATDTRWLLVSIDADTFTVGRRLKELDEKLPDGARRSPRDPVCVLVPKRHVETWVYHLLRPHEAVSETAKYRDSVSNNEVVKAGQRLAEVDPRNHTNCPPSLSLGYAELMRIPC